ncbi:DUF4097 family beta strand repeat-containing protein [Streptomyces sp. NPDC101393]|uniref:DUF4097 family beta strand repeat-containing protein n=1 Tax=Streptomyces sp. NPDC101393 TaxID=3366141 RepID=UPI0038219028
MRKFLGLFGAAAMAGIGAIGLTACSLTPGSTFEDDSSVPKAKKITSVRLDSRSGSVTLNGGKDVSKVSVHREVEYHGDRPKGATHRVEDGVLVLGGCGKDCSVSYTVDLPAGLPVNGETSNGAIHLTGVGAVKVTTSNGAIDLKGVRGPVDVETADGRIHGTGLSGKGIKAKTSNGAIELTPTTAQNVRADTSNGAVTVTVPDGTYRVRTETSNGHKDIGVTDDPAGAHRLDLTTSNGAITLKRG